MDGIVKLSTGKLVSLSEQELVDCDYTDKGCKGRLMDNAFEFVIKNGGLATEADYPNTGAYGSTCDSSTTTTTITGHEDMPANNEASLLKAVVAQPVSLAIDGGDNLFWYYKSDMLSGACGTKLDHGIAAVGYGVSRDGTKFWVMKNSWGTGWGEDGFIRMERDVADEQGLCRLAMQPSYPTALPASFLS